MIRNRMGSENFLKSRLTAFLLNNILASMTSGMGILFQFFPERAPDS